MECILRHIGQYPFDITHSPHLVTFNYTCFVDGQTADKLEIQTHAFRHVVNDEGQQIMLLVVRDQSIVASEVDSVLHVPFNILRQFRNNHPRVLLNRKVVQLDSSLLPKLEEAKEINLYFNDGLLAEKSLIEGLTASSFMLKTGECYLQLKWLEGVVNKIKNMQLRLELGQCIHGSHNVCYLRCYMQVVGQGLGYFIFRRGVTKINVKQLPLHPYNIYKTVTLDKCQKTIYQLQPYLQLSKDIKAKCAQSKILLLEGQEGMGLDVFLHSLSQRDLGLNYYCIDCDNIYSTNQFFRQLRWMTNLQDSLVFIRNIDFIMELYQAEMILSMEVKLLMSKIEDEFRAIIAKTMRKYVLVIEYHGKTITSDMFQQVQSVSLTLSKPMKLYIFKQVFNHFEEDNQLRDQLAQYGHDKFGWEIWKQFLNKEWQGLKATSSSHSSYIQSATSVIKQMAKLVKQEQAQNLIEVSWDDVGGLQTAKEQIIQTILLPIQHPQIFDEWIRPRTGLLFYGPPGTGKTLLGKCIAKECKMSFISVKGPELLNMYVGESQKNVRQVFERAIACKPCIVFMDQLDALIPKRGNNSDSHQVMDRIVAELLMQMDIASSNQVFVIGATNRPDLLDPSILRPGRFDKQIYLGITTNNEDRIKILKAQTRHLTLEENFDWSGLLSQLPINFTGADFYGLTSKAVMVAAQRAISEYQRGIQQDKIRICQSDFLQACDRVKPSVTETDLKRYDELKKIYS